MKPANDQLGNLRNSRLVFQIAVVLCGFLILCAVGLATMSPTLQISGLRYLIGGIQYTTLQYSIDPNSTDPKYILMWTTMFGYPAWYMTFGTSPFNNSGCPEQRCVLTNDRKMLPKSSLVMFHARDVHQKDMPGYHHPQQLWLIHTMESPYHTFYQPPHYLNEVFNVKSSYMHSSDIYTPYNKIYQLQDKMPLNLTSDLIKSKSKLMLWYVSNCGSRSNRKEYAAQLKKYIPVDVFGSCGQPDPCKRNRTCVSQLKQKYKFYLAFENSKCKDYITEKFYDTLASGMVPIVLGASLKDYEQIAPPDSYLHVDNFTSAEALAKYIQYLDHNEEAYTRYLLWKRSYRVGRLAPYRFPCQLCTLAHNVTPFFDRKYRTGELWDRTKLCK